MATVLMQHFPIATRIPVLSTTGVGRALNARLVWVNPPIYNNTPAPVEAEAQPQLQIDRVTVSPPRLP